MSSTFRENNFPYSNPLQITRLTSQEIHERKGKGLCFTCNIKYSKGHKCSEKHLFDIHYGEEEENEKKPSQVEEMEETTAKEITPTISCHALIGIRNP